ncbi:hypothetical protein LAUMK13_00975 [Mycobacterium innocens]|uniref:YcaO domain-containing protein n=1 Tax=Mycobacterium innocens TaxID=2341083 RepID=A0A498PV70_9MYCO|nr:hypothetical protein LAUMK13_00975 [Mycobacterium innocens]
MSVGPDWSQCPTRVLGNADPTSIARRAGTYRIISPEQTWQAVQPMLESAGITRVADLTWLDDLGIPTVQAVRPASLTLSVSQGKATTYRAAQVSAVMESLETWHAENVTPDLFSMTTRDIAAALTYDPAQLLLSARSIYHPGAKLDWMTATTLLTGRQTWVPWEAVLVNAAVHNRWDPPMFSMDTTGLASGNSYWEASLPSTRSWNATPWPPASPEAHFSRCLSMMSPTPAAPSWSTWFTGPGANCR